MWWIHEICNFELGLDYQTSNRSGSRFLTKKNQIPCVCVCVCSLVSGWLGEFVGVFEHLEWHSISWYLTTVFLGLSFVVSSIFVVSLFFFLFFFCFLLFSYFLYFLVLSFCWFLMYHHWNVLVWFVRRPFDVLFYNCRHCCYLTPVLDAIGPPSIHPFILIGWRNDE